MDDKEFAALRMQVRASAGEQCATGQSCEGERGSDFQSTFSGLSQLGGGRLSTAEIALTSEHGRAALDAILARIMGPAEQVASNMDGKSKDELLAALNHLNEAAESYFADHTRNAKG